jgi:hypothetical protein
MKKLNNSIVNGKEHLFVISGLVISYLLIVVLSFSYASLLCGHRTLITDI